MIKGAQVSLYPLWFEEVLTMLLKAPPKPQEKKRETKVQNR
jgi:hypothetical protein